MARTFEIELIVPMTVIVHDEDVIDRVLQNKDDDGVPQKYGSGKGWRDQLYNLESVEEIISMLAYNGALNNADVSRLDGWADLEAAAVELHIHQTDIGYFKEEA